MPMQIIHKFVFIWNKSDLRKVLQGLVYLVANNKRRDKRVRYANPSAEDELPRALRANPRNPAA